MSYAEGKTHLIADAMSRAPVFDPPDDEEPMVNTVLTDHIASDPALQSLYNIASADSDYQLVVDALNAGLRQANMPPKHPARVFRSVWDDLSVLDDVLLVLDDSRLVNPKEARPAILEKLHAAHSGITKTRQLARSLYYWPGMNVAISNLIENCDLCQTLRPSLHDKDLQHPKAEAPMHSISLDLFSWAGKDYLVMVDRYSYYIWVQVLNGTYTSKITSVLDRWFLDFGYPFIIISDNGPQFRDEFKDYCLKHNIIHSTSSPYNPRSNGLAESAVKSAKYLLRKSDNFKDFQHRLQAWRNMPSANSSFSPAEKFFSRRQRADLPSLTKLSLPTPPPVSDSSLPPLQPGDPVRLQHPTKGTWEEKGVVSAIQETGLSYLITRSDGSSCVRGRRLVKFDKAAADVDLSSLPPPITPARPIVSADNQIAPDNPSGSETGQPLSLDPPVRRSRRKRRKPKRFEC